MKLKIQQQYQKLSTEISIQDIYAKLREEKPTLLICQKRNKLLESKILLQTLKSIHNSQTLTDTFASKQQSISRNTISTLITQNQKIQLLPSSKMTSRPLKCLKWLSQGSLKIWSNPTFNKWLGKFYDRRQFRILQKTDQN